MASGEERRDLLRIDKTFEMVMPLAKAGGRIFDVGCGTGRLLGLLKQNGYTAVSGIDQSPAAAEIARAKYDVPVTVGSIFDYEERDLDLVTTCHVMEHIVDLPAFLMCLYELIGAGGILYVEVPDASAFGRFVDPESPEEWLYIRDLYTHFTPEHMNFFSPVSLRNLMTRFGFEELFCRSEPLGVVASAWKRRRIEVDSTAPQEILAYAEKSRELQGRALETLRELAESRREILVWGARTAHTAAIGIERAGRGKHSGVRRRRYCLSRRGTCRPPNPCPKRNIFATGQPSDSRFFVEGPSSNRSSYQFNESLQRDHHLVHEVSMNRRGRSEIRTTFKPSPNAA